MMSDCCNAENLWDMGICSECGEHAEFINEERMEKWKQNILKQNKKNNENN